MLGNWRTRSSEPIRIRELNAIARPFGGAVDKGLVNGRSRKPNPAPAPYKRPNRPKNRKEL